MDKDKKECRKSTGKKALMVAGSILLAVILLFPVKCGYKDGGTVEYRAVLYSVKDWRALWDVGPDGEVEIREGITVEILGIEVFDNTYLRQL